MLRSVILVILIACVPGASSAQSGDGRVEVGGQLVATGVGELDVTDVGFGGRIGFRASAFLTFEGELNILPADVPDRFPISASRLEGLFGATIGPRFGRVSVFGKLRPGFLRFGGAPKPVACIAIFPPPLSCTLATGRTVFALDLGGGIEIHPGERLLLRVDVSDLLLSYPGPAIRRHRNVVLDETFWGHNVRVATGAGFRF